MRLLFSNKYLKIYLRKPIMHFFAGTLNPYEVSTQHCHGPKICKRCQKLSKQQRWRKRSMYFFLWEFLVLKTRIFCYFRWPRPKCKQVMNLLSYMCMETIQSKPRHDHASRWLTCVSPVSVSGNSSKLLWAANLLEADKPESSHAQQHHSNSVQNKRELNRKARNVS